MKLTKKYKAALKVVGVDKSVRVRECIENEVLYRKLEDAGYWWDHKVGKWDNTPHSESIFLTPDGKPSGALRIRVMAHPDDLDNAIAAIKESTGYRITEVSEQYNNRNGAGVRVYLTCQMKKPEVSHGNH